MSLVKRFGGAVAGLAFGLALCLAGPPAMAAPTFPAFTGRVVDQAHVLTPEMTAQLTQELGDLQAKTSRQLVIVTLSSLQGDDIADYGYQLGRAWGVGQKGLNNGAIFIVVPAEHKVRIEVGYGLEPILTDALSDQILLEKVIPKFKAGDVQGGIVDGAQALTQQLSLDTSTAEQKAAEARRPAPSGSARLGNSPLAIIVLGFLLFWVVGGVLGGGRRGGGVGWIFPLLFLGGMGGGGRYRDDDDFGGGGGGGGFSGGGGGSFGGGGASGSW